MGQAATHLAAAVSGRPPSEPLHLALPAPSRIEEIVGEEEDEHDDVPSIHSYKYDTTDEASPLPTVGLTRVREALELYVAKPARALTDAVERERYAAIRLPQVLALHGPPGTGKRHLLREVLRAGGDQMTVVWIDTEGDLDAVLEDLHTLHRQPRYRRQAMRRRRNRTLNVFVLAHDLLDRAFACRERLKKLVQYLRNAPTSRDMGLGLQPRLVLLYDGSTRNELPVELRHAVQRWVYARPPGITERTAILQQECTRLLASPLGCEQLRATVSPAILADIATCYEWWTGGELSHEVHRCAERLVAEPDADFGALLAAWPDHDGHLAERQDTLQQRCAPFEDLYGLTNTSLERIAASSATAQGTTPRSSSSRAGGVKRPYVPTTPVRGTDPRPQPPTKRVRLTMPDPSPPPPDTAAAADHQEKEDEKTPAVENETRLDNNGNGDAMEIALNSPPSTTCLQGNPHTPFFCEQSPSSPYYITPEGQRSPPPRSDPPAARNRATITVAPKI